MRGGFLIAVLFGAAQAASLAAIGAARAEDDGAPPAAQEAQAPEVSSAPTEASPSILPGAGSAPATDSAAVEAPPVPAHPVVAIIRSKLAASEVTKGADTADVAGLQAFYAERSGPPLWATDMGFSARGQAVLVEIERADEWGLDAKAFDLPNAAALPANEDAQALAEIALDLAILKYARYARGGRYDPGNISDLVDQAPPIRDPKTVIAEIGTATTPGAYLTSLHPTHEQFVRLRTVLLEARDKEDGNPDTRDIKRIVMNMERWRWMPAELSDVYVWINVPEFRLYVVSNGEEIFADKALVGTIGKATPVFSADMKTIVFNPDWVAPPSVLEDKLWPALKRKYYNILKSNKLLVSYQGKPVDASKVDWNRVNIHNFTFTQRAGPTNVLGKVKFLYPNKHIVYMHDTLPYRRKVFKEKVRAIGYGCVRMEQPKKFSEILLAKDKQWSESQVDELWDKGHNKSVSIDRTIPVHTTYFTVVVDKDGKVETFGDLYGIDRKMAIAMFGSAEGFPEPPPEPKQPQGAVASSGPPSRHTGGGSGIASSLGFIGD